MIINDGFSTTFNFSLAPNVKFKEKEVTPPSLTGGGENDTTTMRNTAYRTKQPKKLISVGNMSATVAYDSEFYSDAVAMLNQNQEIVLFFADGTTLSFWGWLDEFTPGSATEGEQPTADVTIIASNQDNSGNEVAPVWAESDTGTA